MATASGQNAISKSYAVPRKRLGIPVIASRTGGLPEAVGHGGILIDEYENPVRWLPALQGLLEDRSAWQDLSEKAIENTRRFVLRREVERLVEILVLG